MVAKRVPLDKDQAFYSLCQQVDELEHKLVVLEPKVESAYNSLNKIESSHDSIKGHIEQFNLSLSDLKSSVNRLSSFEGDLRAMRDKFLSYESRFQTMDEMKKILWAVLLAVIPGAFGVCLEVAKFFVQKGM